MESYTYFGRKDAEALDEYRQNMQNPAAQTVTEKEVHINTVSKSSFSQPTLADIKRKNQEEVEALRDEAHLKRFRIHNYTSEDSQVAKAERPLKTLYCSVCGAHCVVTDATLVALPRRSTDGAFALQDESWFHKKYVLPGDRVLIRRSTGVDVQYRFKCKDCDFTLGYQSIPFSEPAKFLYFFSDALVSEQSSAFALQGLS